MEKFAALRKVRTSLQLLFDKEAYDYDYMSSSLSELLRQEILNNFTDKGKETFLEYILESNDETWLWMQLIPEGIQFFRCYHLEVFFAVLQRIRSIEEIFAVIVKHFEKEDRNILHILVSVTDLMNDDQVSLIMHCLKLGVKPDVGSRSFLDVAPVVENKLSLQIKESLDSWIKVFWTQDQSHLKNWTLLGSETLLVDILKRMSIYLSNANKDDLTFDLWDLCPIMWSKKTLLPQAFKEYLSLLAKRYDRNEEVLKKYCKNRLHIEMAEPFYEDLKIYSSKGPTMGFYIKSFLWLKLLAFLLRIWDPTSDWTITMGYIFNWNETVLQNFNCYNCTYQTANELKEMCIVTHSRKTACQIALMDHWTPAGLSIFSMLLTYTIEGSIICWLIYKNHSGFKHYSSVISGSTSKVWNYFAGFLLGFAYNQTTISIYDNWMNGYHAFWTKEKKEMINFIKIDEDCNHCLEDSNFACVFCNRNLKDSKKLNQLVENSLEVQNVTTKVLASTENLLMPMIQLPMIFPTIIQWLSYSNVDIEILDATYKNYLSTAFTLVSVMLSIFGLSWYQMNVYFASPGKQNEKAENKLNLIVMLLTIIFDRELLHRAVLGIAFHSHRSHRSHRRRQPFWKNLLHF